MQSRKRWFTPWYEFLEELVINEESSRKPWAIFSSTVLASKSFFSGETFATPHVQIAMEYLLEYGAELELSMHQPSLEGLSRMRDTPHQIRNSKVLIDARIDPWVTLRAWLPMDKGSRWPRLLESYLQPTKREEIREARQRIVENWTKASGA